METESSKFEKMVSELREGLAEGGPPVQWDLIYKHFAGNLNNEDDSIVGTNSVKWQAWHNAYWEVFFSLQTEHGSAMDSLQETNRKIWDLLIKSHREGSLSAEDKNELESLQSSYRKKLKDIGLE
ncbi:hypothetical protein HOF56_04815 [Candidatus Peribacteria bacterium]|jgi:hypothetical protein|nr:hypothetical protein [Candidatus Peribacteria bacterium]MBT4240642.1 hypothetical protein [Candidatus Peribacteria bacterium]